MGYERNDRRPGRDGGHAGQDYSGQNRFQGQASGQQRDYRGGEDRGRDDSGRYGRQPQGYDHDERGFFDRAGDEVRSWFGDDEAERRREADERAAEREYRSSGGGASGGSYSGARAGSTGGYADVGPGGGRADYGAGRGAGATSSWGLGGGRDHDGWGHDPSYRSWRDRQMADIDRDYDEYRRENQSKFDSEFGSWRTTRQGQRSLVGQVREHQEVVGSDGQHVGTVDKVRGDRIILTKNDQDAGGHHHSIPCSWVQSVEDKVTINKSADEAQKHWRDEEANNAFGRGGNQDRGDDRGPHTLNRSFSGTY